MCNTANTDINAYTVYVRDQLREGSLDRAQVFVVLQRRNVADAEIILLC